MAEQNNVEWLSSDLKLQEAKAEVQTQVTKIVFAVNDNGKEREATEEEAKEFDRWCS